MNNVINYELIKNKLFYEVKKTNFSVRSLNCFEKLDIIFIGDLIQKTDHELLKQKNFGRKCLREVTDILNKLGLYLGVAIPNWNALREKEIEIILERIKSKDQPIILEKNIFARLFLHVEELDLSIRALNCLQAMKVIYIGDLVHCTAGKLMKQKNFGRKVLSEIGEKLNDIKLQLEMNISGWPPINIDEEKKLYVKELISFRNRAQQKITSSISCSNSLEEELSALLDSIVAPKTHERDKKFILKYYGWDGKGGKTLESIGNEYGVTRERVRQVCDEFLKRLERNGIKNKIQLPLVTKTIQFVKSNLPTMADEIEQKLIKEGITKTKFHLDGLKSLSNLLGIKIPFNILTLKNKRLVVSPKGVKISKSIIPYANKIITSSGVCTISDVTSYVEDTAGQSMSHNFVTSILCLRKDFKWLDQDNGWFWFASTPRNRLVNLIEKILSVAPCISISEMRQGIGRDVRMNGFSPSSHVLLEFCRQIPWCNVENKYITATSQLEWKDLFKGTIEGIMCSILQTNGMVMTRTSFQNECLKHGINRNSFYKYLCYSPIITKFKDSVYGIRGAKIPPGIIESIYVRPKPKKVIQDYGWTVEGHIWITFILSEAILETGICGIPSAMKNYLQGLYTLKTIDGAIISNLTVKNNNAWGLKKLFERRGGEIDDHLALKFNPANHTVKAYIGFIDINKITYLMSDHEENLSDANKGKEHSEIDIVD